jgi:hypothetical protein
LLNLIVFASFRFESQFGAGRPQVTPGGGRRETMHLGENPGCAPTRRLYCRYSTLSGKSKKMRKLDVIEPVSRDALSGEPALFEKLRELTRSGYVSAAEEAPAPGAMLHTRWRPI